MKLSGLKIKEEYKNNNIYIEEFDEERLNPNSYNLRLHNKLKVYELEDDEFLDMRKDNKTKDIIIPKEGYVIKPGELYLGRTVEFTKTHNLVPGIEGRSSIARLGIEVHVSAGFGDNGFEGYWTLEITCVKPVKIYPNEEICQIFYEPLLGDSSMKYNGKYQNNNGIQTSQIFKEIKRRNNKKSILDFK